jgi:hypothetical protein
VTQHWDDRGQAVCNLVVEGEHDYFVGTAEGGVWVHNGSCQSWVNDVPGGTYRPAKFPTQADAWIWARRKLGPNQISGAPFGEPYKWRNPSQTMQLRAKPGDINDVRPHIHIEIMNPRTGQVLTNWHLYW